MLFISSGDGKIWSKAPSLNAKKQWQWELEKVRGSWKHSRIWLGDCPRAGV